MTEDSVKRAAEDDRLEDLRHLAVKKSHDTDLAEFGLIVWAVAEIERLRIARNPR